MCKSAKKIKYKIATPKIAEKYNPMSLRNFLFYTPKKNVKNCKENIKMCWQTHFFDREKQITANAFSFFLFSFPPFLEVNKTKKKNFVKHQFSSKKTIIHSLIIKNSVVIRGKNPPKKRLLTNKGHSLHANLRFS